MTSLIGFQRDDIKWNFEVLLSSSGYAPATHFFLACNGTDVWITYFSEAEKIIFPWVRREF